MILTREEKDRLIEDLYNQGKTYQQIAREVRVSVRDIKPTLEKAEKEKKRSQGEPIKKGKKEVINNKNHLVTHTVCSHRGKPHLM